MGLFLKKGSATLKKLKNPLKNIQFFITSICYKSGVRKIKDEFHLAPVTSQSLFIKKKGIGGEIPRIIWMYWDSTKPPSIVDSCLAKVKSLNPNHNVVLLNKESVKEFLPDTDFLDSNLCNAHKSDYLRLNLLYLYGGIWVDATTLVYNDFSWVHESQEYDLCAYYRDVSTTDKEYPIVETWLLAAPKMNEYIKSWLDNFKPIVTLGSHDYFNTLQNRKDFKKISQKITSPDYLMLNLAQQIAARETDHSFNLRRSEDCAFYYQRLYKWDTIMSAIMLMVIEKPSQTPELIKLTSMERRFIGVSRSLRIINKKSIFGDLNKAP